MASLPTSSAHCRRLQCIYFDDLIAAVRQCHENFLLIQKSLTALNRQMSSRRIQADTSRLIKTEQGLVRESALQLEKAMREVLNAVEEHFAFEVKQPGSGTQDRLWTLTEEMMRQPDRSGAALLASLAAVVAEERQCLDTWAKNYSLEDDLRAFQQSSGSCDAGELQRLVSSTQREHVRRFLHTQRREKQAAAMADEVDALSAEYLASLERQHRNQRQSEVADGEAARSRKEDWSHALEERLELVVLEAEAKCLEDLRKQLQEEAEAAIASQDSASASRAVVDAERSTVHANQETVRRLSRRNRDARRRLEDTRSESQPLAASCAAGLDAGAVALQSCAAALSTACAASPGTSPAASPAKRPPGTPPALSADASISRMARLVVSENGRRGVGGADFARLVSVLRRRCEKMDSLLRSDAEEAAACMTFKAPLVALNREAVERAAGHVAALEDADRERRELPKALEMAPSAAD